MKKIVIAIDGFSSCGKSTLANQLAKELNYVFVDSGAMYRAITLFFLDNNIDINKSFEVDAALNNIKLEFVNHPELNKSSIYLNGMNVDEKIRDKNINNKVSIVAANKAVREFAIAQQKIMGKNKAIVMDGRDIGTTVFPDAELKIFVTAEVDIRVERRFKELQEKGFSTSVQEVKNNLLERDYIDSNREFSPLKKAADAIVLDNSKLTKKEQLKLVLQWANEKINS